MPLLSRSKPIGHHLTRTVRTTHGTDTVTTVYVNVVNCTCKSYRCLVNRTVTEGCFHIANNLCGHVLRKGQSGRARVSVVLLHKAAQPCGSEHLMVLLYSLLSPCMVLQLGRPNMAQRSREEDSYVLVQYSLPLLLSIQADPGTRGGHSNPSPSESP